MQSCDTVWVFDVYSYGFIVLYTSKGLLGSTNGDVLT